jgi:hypothetical protein
MMRVTGYTLAITGRFMAERRLAAGVHTMDEAMPADEYIAALAQRGIAIRMTSLSAPVHQPA